MSEREPIIGTIHFDGFLDLTVDMVWPDGDQPEEITAEAIAAVMRSCGGQNRVIHDWNLEPSLQVDVTCPGSPPVVEVWKGPFRRA